MCDMSINLLFLFGLFFLGGWLEIGGKKIVQESDQHIKCNVVPCNYSFVGVLVGDSLTKLGVLVSDTPTKE